VEGAELDVNDTRLFFHAPGKYRLSFDLPYDVFGDQGRAPCTIPLALFPFSTPFQRL